MKTEKRRIFIIIITIMIMLSGCNSNDNGATQKPPESENELSSNSSFPTTAKNPTDPTYAAPSSNAEAPETSDAEDTTHSSKIYTNSNNLATGGIACNTDYGVIFTNAIKGVHMYSEMMRIDNDGSKKIIAGYPAKYINYDGEDVYFCSNELYNYYKTDRSGYWGIHKKVSSQNLELLYPGNAKYLVLKGDYLYFCDYLSKPPSEAGGKLTKMNKDGNGLTILSESRCSFINIVDDWIYYIADNKEIRKISLSGENEQTILKGITLPRNLNYEKGYLYWLEEHYGRIVRMKTDGTEKEDVVEGRITAFIVNNGMLYYLNLDEPDFDGVIRGMKLITFEILSGMTREFDLTYDGVATEDISLIENWLYLYIETGESVEQALSVRINVENGEMEVLDDISYNIHETLLGKITVEEAENFEKEPGWIFEGIEEDTGHYYMIFSNPGIGTGGCAYINPYNGIIFYGPEKDYMFFSTRTYSISKNPDSAESNIR